LFPTLILSLFFIFNRSSFPFLLCFIILYPFPSSIIFLTIKFRILCDIVSNSQIDLTTRRIPQKTELLTAVRTWNLTSYYFPLIFPLFLSCLYIYFFTFPILFPSFLSCIRCSFIPLSFVPRCFFFPASFCHIFFSALSFLLSWSSLPMVYSFFVASLLFLFILSYSFCVPRSHEFFISSVVSSHFFHFAFPSLFLPSSDVIKQSTLLGPAVRGR
jgi:hypothetical protein